MLPALPTPVAVATGRLGRLYPRVVTDDAIGAMLGVAECIDVPSPAVATALSETLGTALDHWSTAIDHPNVFQYDNVHVTSPADTSIVELQAHRAITQHLHGVVRAFGRLHGAVIRQYMHAIVCGLVELHQHGLTCGGLSLSNLFLCEGRVQIGGWFPPISVLQTLRDAHPSLFTNNPFAQSVLRRHGEASPLELQQRDLQSLAFLLIEMHTGERVMLDILGDGKDELMTPFHANAMERGFLLELLQPTTLLKMIETHPYLLDDPATNPISQRELVSLLIEKELVKCRAIQRTDAQQVRAWLAQFEKKFQRQPQSDERPASIQRLQQRCRALHERILELERRARAMDQTDDCEGEMPEPLASRGSPTQTESTILSVTTLGIDTSDTIGSNPTDLDRRRRSPAQNAFLRQLATDTRDSSVLERPASNPNQARNDIVGGRERGHELLHQRKEVMGVIRGLEQ